jgi:sugar (pentulose or hexulose) kinase
MISAGQMADVAQRDWAYDLLDAVGIPRTLLPPTLEAGTRVAGLSDWMAQTCGLREGTPVHVGGGDTQFGALGVGGMRAGCVVIVGGSTTPIQMTTDVPLRDPRRCPWVSTHLAPHLWAAEANAGHTGMIYKWFRDTFFRVEMDAAQVEGRDPYLRLNQLADASPIGAHDLLTLAANPRWAQDTWERKPPYAIYNFNVAHTLGDVARSILEGVCYGIRGNLEYLERAAGKPFSLRLFTGGATRSALWNQMLADVVGHPIHVPAIEEPALMAGAWLVAREQGIASLPVPPATTLFEPDLERHTEYEPFYQRYLNVFENLQKSFGK